MEKICGYKGLNGQFYKTKKKCEEADIEYKLKETISTLNNFSDEIENYIFRHGTTSLNTEFNNRKDQILDIVSRSILVDSDKFIEIINKKKQLEKELDKLQKIKSNWWWLKYKWW